MANKYDRSGERDAGRGQGAKKIEESNSDKKHIRKIDLKHGHITKSSSKGNGGGCLSRHTSGYCEKNSCNHRWQAHLIARKEKGIYECYEENIGNSKKNKKMRDKGISTSAYETTKTKKIYPSYYCYKLKIPQKGDWDVDGPGREYDIRHGMNRGERYKNKKGLNFTKNPFPYWHNAHHLLPNGTLNSVLDEAKGDALVVIRSALLKARYNVNHRINMMNLPQDKEVGKILKLPRHLILKDVKKGEKTQCFNHPQYNDIVKKGLKQVKEKIKEIMDEYEKPSDVPHGLPMAEDIKEYLEDISIKCHAAILDFGENNAGAALDKMSEEEFKFGTKKAKK